MSCLSRAARSLSTSAWNSSCSLMVMRLTTIPYIGSCSRDCRLAWNYTSLAYLYTPFPCCGAKGSRTGKACSLPFPLHILKTFKNCLRIVNVLKRACRAHTLHGTYIPGRGGEGGMSYLMLFVFTIENVYLSCSRPTLAA